MSTGPARRSPGNGFPPFPYLVMAWGTRPVRAPEGGMMSAGPQLSPESNGLRANQSPVIRVLLVVDMDLLRDALVTLLSEQRDMEVVADLKCDDNVVPIACRVRPDVAVIDVDQPCTFGLTIIPELRARLPHTQVVALAATRSP